MSPKKTSPRKRRTAVDREFETKEHDEILAWLSRNWLKILRACDPALSDTWDSEAIAAGTTQYPKLQTMPPPDKPEVEVEKKGVQHLIDADMGYIDLYLCLSVPQLTTQVDPYLDIGTLEPYETWSLVTIPGETMEEKPAEKNQSVDPEEKAVLEKI